MAELIRKRIVSKVIAPTANKKRAVRRGVLGVKPVVVLPPSTLRDADGDIHEPSVTIARYKSKVHNPLTAIRANCVECSGGSLKEITECKVLGCALYPFRMGTNPFHKKTRERVEREETDDDS